jgi:DNA-binding Xre family transcriptional regulator
LGILRERDMSLGQLARESGISASSLSLITTGGIAYPRTVTIQRICGALKLPTSALMSPDPRSLTTGGSGPRTTGVAVVPIVRLDQGAAPIDTGQTTLATADQLDQYGRLLGTYVGAGGLGPYVLPGDLVIVAPGARPEPGQAVLVVRASLTFAAYYVVEDDGRVLYRLSDGSWLDPDRDRLVGPIVSIVRQPPKLPAARRHPPH